MMSTRRSLLVIGCLAALVLVGGAVEVGAQTYNVTFSPSEVTEGPSAKATLKVSYSGELLPAADPVTVTPMERSASQAMEGVDYTVVPATWAAKMLTATVKEVTWDVVITDDEDTESRKTLRLDVEIAPSSGATVNDAADLIILDDDDPKVSTLTLKVSDNAVSESDTARAREVTVTVETANEETFTEDQIVELEFRGSATKDEDYTVEDEVLSLLRGKTSTKTTLTVEDDDSYDGRVADEIDITAFVDGKSTGPGTVTITITDNEQDPSRFTVEVDPAMAAEGEVFTVTLSSMVRVPSAQKFSVSLAGTADQNTDYTGPETITMEKDKKEAEFQVQTIKDEMAEPDETIMITVMLGSDIIGDPLTVTITGDADAADPTDEPEEEETDEPEEEETDEPEEEETDEPEEAVDELAMVEFTATAGDASIMVSWTAVEGATGYCVEWQKIRRATRRGRTTAQTAP